VHAGISGAALTAQVDAHPDAELYVHPECGCATSALYLAGAGAGAAGPGEILSTGGMLDAARASHGEGGAGRDGGRDAAPAPPGRPEVDFRAVNDRASCRYMKMITPRRCCGPCARSATRCTSTPSSPPAAAPPCSG
jgi:quinolinate synthase